MLPLKHSTFRFPSLLLVSLLALLTLELVRAVDLFAFRDSSGRVLAFAVPNTDVISRS